MKIPFAAVLVALAFSQASYGQESALGAQLEGLLHFAREHNPEYTGMRFEAQAAAERVLPAGALPDPRVGMELRDITRMGERNPSLLPGRVGSTRYSVSQDLPWAGKRELKRDIAELQAESTRSKSVGAWSELAAKIKSTYAQLYYLEQSDRILQEIQELMSRLERVAQLRYAGGLAAQQDVIRAQLEQTSTRNEAISLYAERRQLQARMSSLVGKPPDHVWAAPGKIRPLPAPDSLRFEVLESRARANNPLLKVEDTQILVNEKNRDLTVKNRYPDFSVGVSPIQYGNSIREWELMVQVNIPLQQDARRAQEREADAMLAAARSRREMAINQLQADLYENLAGLEAARKTLALITDSLLPQSELAFRSALIAYESGKVDFATLLDAQKQIRQARLNQIKAGMAAQMRLADLERLVGEDL